VWKGTSLPLINLYLSLLFFMIRDLLGDTDYRCGCEVAYRIEGGLLGNG